MKEHVPSSRKRGYDVNFQWRRQRGALEARAPPLSSATVGVATVNISLFVVSTLWILHYTAQTYILTFISAVKVHSFQRLKHGSV
jgi:hypothetical protein